MADKITKREKEYLYWLWRIPFMGAVTIAAIWEQFNSFESPFYIEETQLVDQGILREGQRESWKKEKQNFSRSLEEYHSLDDRGIQFITPFDEAYPNRLREIYGNPMGLCVKGRLPREDVPTAAIIGARGCTSYGSQLARNMGKELAEHGVQIISGLAAGIDGAGHLGALDAGKTTFGILGCGINICYPSEHYPLYQKVEKQGGLISEFPLGSPPKPAHFPMRNRIISGLSDVVLVMEAKKKSGSLITAELALEQGKEVFALPGRVTDPLSAGCNGLIEAGAGILTSTEIVLEYLGLQRGKILIVNEKNENGLAKEEKMVYSCLDLEPKFLEQIVKESGLPVSRCMSILLELELRGFIVQTSNHYYGRRL